MKLFNDLPIRGKIVFTVLMISIITISSGMLLEFYFEKERQRESIINKTKLDALLISQYCGLPMDFENSEAAFDVLEKLSALPEVYNGLLFDNHDSLFAYYSKGAELVMIPPDGLLKNNYVFEDDWLHVYQPVVYKDKEYGYLYLRVFTNINEISKERIIRQLIIMAAMMILALLLSGVFQRIISGPILRLTNFTNKISTKGDYSLRIEKQNKDEIGALYDEFNNMLSVIENTKGELEAHKNHLEELVDQRTNALKSTNEELLSAKVAAEKASQAKSEFLSNMSHELRTPLNGILGYAQILKTIGRLNDNQKEFVEIIHSSGKHLLDLISEILSYSRIEAKKLQLIISEFNVGEMIQHTLNIIRIKAEEKDLVLSYDKQSDVPETVRGDEVKMRQLLLNLLSNAVKYTKKGEVVLRVRFEESNKHNFVFEVEDTGVGIAEEKIEHIFEPFTQIGDQWKYVEGTGLGLAITKKIIGLMAGTLEVKSEVGRGSMFRICVNLPEVTDLNDKSLEEKLIKGYEGDQKTILAVDENLTNLSFIVSALEPLGFELLIAENGQEAIEQAKRKAPDLVLMDLVMPLMNGSEAIDEIRKIPGLSKVKIAGVTASVIEHKELTEFIKKCNANIEKPVKLNELHEVIRELLNIKWIEDKLTEVHAEPFPKDLPIIVPDNIILNSIIELAEIGDFISIEKLLSELAPDKRYFPFNKKLAKFIEKYNSSGLINYLNTLIS